VSARAEAVQKGRRSSSRADLKAVLADRDFRKLFATRLVSQTGDGIVTAAVGTYVFFNASTFPSPMAGAAAFAVLYLPYSLIGPFAGVLIDRWSRRQILVWSAPIRAALVLVTAALMVAGNRSVPLYIAVLALLGVSRFLLSSFSTALPHVTPEDKLVVANALSDTVGGIMSALGGIVALGLNAATGDTERGAAVTMLVGGGCYVAASMVATIMPRDLLGPDQAGRSTVRLAADLREVAAGLLAGARYVLSRRGPRAALGATGAYNFLFGPLFLMSVLLYRNYFYPGHVTVAESHVGELAVVSAVGYACAALITPFATRRLSKQAWIALMLLAAAVVAGIVGETFNQVAYLAIGFLMYLSRQGVAISAVTILQEEVEDVYRGRVFALYDMVFNASYAVGAALFAVFMAPSGKSPVVVAVIAIAFVLAAAAYWLSSGGSAPAESGATGESGLVTEPRPSAGRSPSADAQRSSS
jgi:MFS-type transporter involved in bile tolerance (Atg22 family)